MKTIAICNQKGGSGKTTTASALAAGLALRGYKVLALDCDPQHNFTSAHCPHIAGKSIADTLAGVPLAEVIQGTGAGFDIVPGSTDFAILPEGFSVGCIREQLAGVAGVYDYCIVDTAPALSLQTMAALASADSVIVAANAEVFSLYGLEQIGDTVEAVRSVNPDLKIQGILLTNFQRLRKLDRTMRDTMGQKAQGMGTKVFDTTIRSAASVVRSAVVQKSDIYRTAPRSGIVRDYEKLIQEMMEA